MEEMITLKEGELVESKITRFFRVEARNHSKRANEYFTRGGKSEGSGVGEGGEE